MLRRLFLSLSLSVTSPRGAIFATQHIDKKSSTSLIPYTPQTAGIAPVSGQMYVNNDGTVRGLMQAAIAGLGKISGGEVTLDGGNPTPVTVTGITTILCAIASLKSATAPGDDPSWLSVDYSGNTLNIYAWKNTGGTDPTLVASTNNTAVVSWIAIGI